jgi:hypothetical protein
MKSQAMAEFRRAGSARTLNVGAVGVGRAKVALSTGAFEYHDYLLCSCPRLLPTICLRVHDTRNTGMTEYAILMYF